MNDFRRRPYLDTANYGYGDREDVRGGGGGFGDGGERRFGDREPRETEERPPHSRLFIIGGKSLMEEDFHAAFGQFGTVERVDMKRGKGITYVKFAKTSEAADALEELNGKSIGDDPRPLKIVIASSRAQGNNRDDVNALRLFVIIPKSYSEDDLRNKFLEFGPIEYVNIIKDKRTDESKGLGYVKFFRFSHAARAFEGVDPEFKPKFAEPRPPGHREGEGRGSGSVGGGGFSGGPSHRAGGFSGGFGGGFGEQGGFGGGYEMPNNIRPSFESTIPNPTGTCRLAFMCNTVLTQEKLWKMFDIIPGLETCELLNADHATDRGYGTVVYNNPNSAAYAIEKLCGFDYPLGSRIMIKFDDSVPARAGGAAAASGGPSAAPQLPSDIKTLVNTIQHATEMLKQAGYGEAVNYAKGEVPVAFEPSMFSGSLPPVQPMADSGAECAERLFVVFKECRTDVPPQNILNDVFGRFGNLIEVFCLNGKKCGYARYAEKASAQKAMETLNHQTLCGAFLKVMVAEQSYSEKVKRARLDEGGEF